MNLIPAESASLRNFLERKILSYDPRLNLGQILGWRDSAACVLMGLPSNSDACSSLGTTAVHSIQPVKSPFSLTHSLHSDQTSVKVPEVLLCSFVGSFSPQSNDIWQKLSYSLSPVIYNGTYPVLSLGIYLPNKGMSRKMALSLSLWSL